MHEVFRTLWTNPNLINMRFHFWMVVVWLVGALSPTLAQPRGELVSATLIRSFTKAQLADVYAANGIPTFFAPIEYAVDAYRLIYRTPAATGDSLTVASGLLAVPQDDCDFPLFNYNHGTAFYGPSVSDLALEWQVGVVMAATGYLAALPDYLGYGATPVSLPHPYLHAETQASAIVDLLRATRQWCQQEGVRLNPQLFLAGYSQGGHAVMAAHRAIETQHSQEFTVTACVPGSGPYDLSGITREALLAEEPSEAFYLAFLMFSYQHVYGTLWSDPTEAFVAPFDSLLPIFFDRSTPPVGVPFPDTAVHMLQPAYRQAVQQDSLHPANRALRANDLYDWTPQAPLRMYYCEADDVVPYQNALFALDQFQQNGATQAEARSAGANSGHEACAIPTFLNTKLWFDNFKAACTPDTTSTAVSSLPKQSLRFWRQQDGFTLRASPTRPFQPGVLRVLDVQGRSLYQQRLQHPAEALTVHLPGLAPGLYVVSWEGARAWRGKWLRR